MRKDLIYENLLRPLAFGMDPESAHKIAQQALASCGGLLAAVPCKYKPADLQTEIAGKPLANPIGLAAGFDKNAKLVEVLGIMGFGFVEVGSVTAKATVGNPRPRLFRLPDDKALINRMGLNGDGADVVARRLKSSHPSLPIAINIAKTHDPEIIGDKAIADILYSFNAIKDIDACYVALNASCPNTREGCMKEKEQLSTVIAEMQKINQSRLPLFVKVSPDSSPELLSDILEIGERFGLAGYVCGNTTVTREGLKTDGAIVQAIGAGGLSGPPLFERALSVCKRLGKEKKSDQSIIAVGGITTGSDAFEFIKSGASLIEIYTAFVYRGPMAARLLCEELSECLTNAGLKLKEAIGIDL